MVRDLERVREQRVKAEPCLQWGDLARLPLLCLSGSGLQRQRKSRNAQAWWWWWPTGTSSASEAEQTREIKVLSNAWNFISERTVDNKTTIFLGYNDISRWNLWTRQRASRLLCLISTSLYCVFWRAKQIWSGTNTSVWPLRQRRKADRGVYGCLFKLISQNRLWREEIAM